MENEVFYYYLRNEKNQPYGCVAIQETANGNINRGVSICSVTDNFNRKHARGLALKRLNIARGSLFGKPFDKYYGNKSTIPVQPDFNKYDCNVKPTEFEARILAKPGEQK